MRKFIFFLSVIALAACTPKEKQVTITVENPVSSARSNEIVEVAWNTIVSSLSLSDNQIIITNESGEQVPYQLIRNGQESIKSLIFPVNVEASSSQTYRIKTGVPEKFTPMVYGRLVPERKDDFTWENNRVAFRVYGPALQATGEISNGMDFWAKKTDSLVIDKWYKNDLSGIASYHEDHGEGLDFYKVGRTLGLGMTAPLYDNALVLGENFTQVEILDLGPLRITFKLNYKPYNVGEKSVVETRIISLDAYSQLNKIINIFDVEVPEMTLATGIVTQGDGTEQTFADNSGIIAYETPADINNGTIFTGVINTAGFIEIKRSEGHFMGLNNYNPGNEYVYYTGGGWSKSGFANFDEWTSYLKSQKDRIDNPLKISVN